MNRIMTFCFLIVTCTFGCSNEREKEEPKINKQTPTLSHEREFLRTVSQLKEISLRKHSITRVRQVDGNIPKKYTSRVEQMLLKQPDYRSFHLWFIYDCVLPNNNLAPELRASILASTLNEMRELNDFGYFSDERTQNNQIAERLIDCGPVAVKFLRSVLDNESRVSIVNLSGVTYDSIYRYRRCDYAYIYISQILGRKTEFNIDPVKRDIEITKLKDYLKTWKPKNSDLPNENH